MQECMGLERLIQREKVPFTMLMDNHVKSIPSQLNFLELFFSVPNIFSQKKEGQSVGSYYSKLVGRKNFERVLGPAMNAVISQQADDFPADMLFKKRSRRKDVIKKFTLPEGLQAITDSISAEINMEIIKGKEVLGVEVGDNLFQVSVDGAVYESTNLALATPVSVTARLLQASFPAAAQTVAQIKVEKVESMGVAVTKEKLSLPPVAGLIPVSDSFYSAVSRDTVRHDQYRGFTFHFKPDLLDREAKLKRIAEALCLDQGELARVVEKENCVPALRVGHDAVIQSIGQALSGKRLLLAGNYFDGMALEDCVARSSSEFRRLMELGKT
jgi:protoporphyrinogen oxidase